LQDDGGFLMRENLAVHKTATAASRAKKIRSKGQSQGHAVMKRAAGVGMQVDMTAWVSS